MTSSAPLLAAALLVLPLAGCATTPAPASSGAPSYQSLGFDGKTWPSLNGTTLTILDHGAFTAFEDAKKLFENLTGAKVVHVPADDSGSALQQAVREKGAPTVDVLYGVDNILYAKAVQDGVFEPYKPLLADRIDPQYVFIGANATWHAAPVDHGYIGVNVDTHSAALEGVTVATLADVRDHADQFVTEDPRTSTPGLGFLLATIKSFPEGSSYDWKHYWNDLFAHHALVTVGWPEAYEQHFSGGYGVTIGGKGDRAIVTSYTESPAYEHFFGTQNLSTPILAPDSTFHQIQTMGIVKGTKHLAAAQAWIEFALTDDYQKLAAPNGVYPVVKGVSVADTYGGIDPAPGTFQPATFDVDTLGKNVEGWVRAWTALCEAANCA